VVQSLRNASDTLTEVFTYTMQDAAGLTSSSQIVVTILGVNDAPINSSRNYSTSYIDTLSVTTGGVLTGATDPEMDAITARLLTVPLSGTLIFNPNGTFTYRPVIEFIGQVTFVYQAFDGSIYSDPITVTIDVFLPRNLPGSGGSGSGGSGGSSSGGGSTSTLTITTDTAAGTAGRVVPAGIDNSIQSTQNSNVATNLTSAAESTEALTPSTQGVATPQEQSGSRNGSNSAASGLAFSATQAGNVDASNGSTGSLDHRDDASQRRVRLQREVSIESDAWTTMHRSEQAEAEGNFFTTSSMVNTALGTGLVLWVIQGAQILAAILSTAPALIQLDPLSVLPSLTDQEEEEPESDSAGKMFDNEGEVGRGK